MKRSEMIEIIKFQLGFYEVHSSMTLDARAFDILGCIEAAGMLPPFYVTEELTERDVDNGYGDWVKIQVTKVTKRKWEPEND